MKKLLLGVVLLGSLSAFAGSMDSILLKGDYKLNTIIKDTISRYTSVEQLCPNFLTVEVNESLVELTDTNVTSYVLAHFDAENEGRQKYNLGNTDLRFNKKSVKEVDTQYVSRAGYAKETRYAKLTRKGQLLVGRKAFGFPISLNHGYECLYDRLAEEN